ncbi:MAG: C25 family cysteine peptidase, partial [Thermoanaerobaculia bacterium]|nr:C25 family cysteine peptidase [Thermoanaerobaculia bacterium]
PTADATGDGPEEDGIDPIVTTVWEPDDNECFTVTSVSNASGGAVLAAWFDWNNDGNFDEADEYYTWTVDNTTTQVCLGDSTSGNTAVGASFDKTNPLAARFRLFSSGAAAPGGSLDPGDFGGLATDGEIEDYLYPANSLPVTLSAFQSEGAPGGPVTVRWQTSSETENVAFEIWGRVDGEWRALSELVASHGGSSALPQSYEVEISAPAGLQALQLVDYDLRGRAERYGGFRVGELYGDFQTVETVDWSGPRAQRSRRLAERGFVDTRRSPRAAEAWKKVDEAQGRGRGRSNAAFRGNAAARSNGAVVLAEGPQTHVAVTETGIQRVTYEALRDGGLDLAGVHPREIAVTWRGEPVARWIDGGSSFGPGGAIEFLGRAPEGDDALYIDASLYQVSVDASRARRAGQIGQGRATAPSPFYLAEIGVDEPVLYHHQSPTGDPWVNRSILAIGGGAPRVASLSLPIDGPLADGPGELIVSLGSVTDLPTLEDAGGQPIPEHNVEVWLVRPDGSREHLTSASTSGQQDWEITVGLARGALQPGLHQVELHFSTDYLFSLVLVDRWGVRHAAPYLGPTLDFAPDPWSSGYRIEGLAGASVAVYREEADGALTRVQPRVQRSGAGYAAEFQSMEAERFWVTELPHLPAVFTTAAPPDLLAGPADLVVIAGSSFIGSPALDDYLAQRSAWSPVVVDVEDVYNAVGFGMALPSAITDYLALRDSFHPFRHVQLVGTDCYDRRNYISSCLSFIPLPTARVGASFYAPSQNRLVDLDGDGIGDKAVAQFSVREPSELATIVAKGEAWRESGLAAGGTALLVAEETDGVHDFGAQIDRLRTRLAWPDVTTLEMEDHANVATARQAFRASLDKGRAITTFSGHSSASVWAFRSLLTTSNVADLTNDGRPTLMVPLACETTYDVSPSANVLGHELLYGGAHGAVAISGAVALANLAENELMAAHVLDGLRAGLTLGEAILAGRQALGASFQELQDNWITQGDVTIGLQP